MHILKKLREKLLKMESGLQMSVHAIIIGVIIYIVLVSMGTSDAKAQDRSALVAGIALVYMVLFGHKSPGSMNPNITM
jgi:hypothetical protein